MQIIAKDQQGFKLQKTNNNKVDWNLYEKIKYKRQKDKFIKFELQMKLQEIIMSIAMKRQKILF